MTADTIRIEPKRVAIDAAELQRRIDAGATPNEAVKAILDEQDTFVAFLKHLHRAGKFGYWWVNPGKRSDWWIVGNPSTIPSEKLNVYFGVHPTTVIPPKNSKGDPVGPEGARSQIAYIAAINCLFAEFDAKDFGNSKPAALACIKNLAKQPSVTIDSGGGYHCYWLLRESFILSTDADRERADKAQKGWVALVGGDDGSKDLARILRVPGTRNYKSDYAPHFPMVHIVQSDLTLQYDLCDLEALIQVHNQNDPFECASRATLPKEDKTTSYAQAAMASEVSALLRSPNGKRNAQLNRAAFALGKFVAAQELDESTVERVLFESAVSVGLNRDEVLPTIRSGMQKGRQVKRQIKLLPKAVSTAIPSFLLTESADDEGNAQCVYQVYGQQFLNCPSVGWLRWNATYWESEKAEEELNQAITETLKIRRVEAVRYDREQIVRAAVPSAKHIRDCKFMFSSMVTASVSEFDADPDMLNCRNGVVDLRTGALLPHRSGQRFTYCIPVDYDPDADWSAWESFLRGVVSGGSDELAYLQMAVGYSLTGHTNEECLFYIHGPTRSGKGTFTETLLAMLPKPIAVETDFTTFTMKRDDPNNFDLAPLKPARFVVASESNKYQALNAGKIKLLTGGNEVYCCYKHHNHFSYRPQYKVWLVSNHPVNADVDDDAVWYRIRVIEFPRSFAGCEDKELKVKMKHPDTLRGVLAWAVVGAAKWFAAQTGLVTPKSVTVVTQQHRCDLDYVQMWIDECCEVDTTKWVSNEAVYTSYKEWCRENGVEAKQARGVALALKGKGFGVGVQVKNAGKNSRGVSGLKLKVWP
jgi:P4 family phage/plasmid primase-like protien